MINKIIFVDFDDTLCLHKKNIYSEKYLAYNPLDICDTVYKDSIPNDKLIKYLYKKKETEDCYIMLLTSACSRMLEIKKVWCTKHCPGLFDDYFAVSIDASKTEIMEAFIDRLGLDKKECLFIDDSCSDRKNAEIYGIQILSPQIIELLEE